MSLYADPHSVPLELKNEGPDWFAIFNPTLPGPERPGGQTTRERDLDVQLVHSLMHESVVCCVRFSPDGNYLATGCNHTAQIYDTNTGQKTCVLVDDAASMGDDLYIRDLCFSPDGKYLVTGGEDKRIRVWDIQKKYIRTIYEGHRQEIFSLDISRDGQLLVSGSRDCTVIIWDMNDTTGQSYKILNIPESDNIDAAVTSVCLSPDGRLVAASSLDTIVRIWDVRTGQLIECLKGHRDSVYSVAFMPDGQGLISGSLDKTLKYWDVRPILCAREGGESSTLDDGDECGGTGSKCTMSFIGHQNYVLSVAVSHDGQWVVSGSKDRGVQFWDANTAIAQCMVQGHKNSIISVGLSRRDNLLATGSGDRQARIWRFKYSNAPAAPMESLPGLLSSICK